ncbi:MAG: ComF family protein [Azospira sp.]|nr:ComF family protein [Azospira sp.]
MPISAGPLATLRRRLLNALLPQDCLLCLAAASDALLCPTCAAGLPGLPAPCCPRCALPGGNGECCGRCQRRPPAFDAMLALHPYAFPVDRLIQGLKYRGELSVAGHFAAALTTACAPLGADLVVPMPLHPSRLAARGFNQAMEIARALAPRLGIPLAARACTRERATVPQEGLSLAERRRNLRGAFACRADFAGFTGRHLLLIDDVATTGASADECARTLKRHGAARVSVVVVARTLLD